MAFVKLLIKYHKKINLRTISKNHLSYPNLILSLLVLTMLRRSCPLHYEHLLQSNSETESDDPSEYGNTQTKKISEKGKTVAAKCQKSKRNKKKIGIREESSRDAKAHKEDPGSKWPNKFQYIYFTFKFVPLFCQSSILHKIGCRISALWNVWDQPINKYN